MYLTVSKLVWVGVTQTLLLISIFIFSGRYLQSLNGFESFCKNCQHFFFSHLAQENKDYKDFKGEDCREVYSYKALFRDVSDNEKYAITLTNLCRTGFSMFKDSGYEIIVMRYQSMRRATTQVRRLRKQRNQHLAWMFPTSCSGDKHKSASKKKKKRRRKYWHAN